MTSPHRRARRTTLACAATTTLLCSALPPAQAQATAPEAPVTQVLITGSADRQTATGPVKGYNARRSATATKTDTPLSETAQSVTVITRDEIVDQGAVNVQDALNYAAGVRSDAYGIDSRSDGFRIRGGNADEYLDGLRKNFDYYTSNARTEPYTLERIDVLRGPAAMLFGQGSTGGVVNLVSKRPQDVAQGEVGLQVGSFGRRQLQADVTGPLTADGQWLYRLVGVARDADTQVDHVSDDRGLLAPSLTWRPSNVTSLTLQGLVQNDDSGSTSQFFPWSGVLTANPNGKLPTSRFIGDPDWDRYDTRRRFAGWLFEHELDSGWTLRQGLRYTHTEVDYRSLYGDSFSLPGGWAADPVGQRLLGRYASASFTKTRLLTIDQNLQGRVTTGAAQHDLLVGLDYARYRKTGTSGFAGPADVPVIDAYDPVYPAFTPPENFAIDPSTQRQVGVYLQDQIRFGERWLITAGLRHDRARNQTEGQASENSSATTKRLGAMYSVAGGWSPYLSYSESFKPVANIGNQRFDPLRGKQWEAGVKHESADGKLLVNAAVYHLREENQLISDPSTNTYSQAGETKARGLELEVKAALPRNVDLVASYTYTDVSEEIEEVPHHQASLWGKWRFAPGLSAGAGVRYKSAFSDGAAPEVPSVTLLDLMLAWENAHWRAALNIANLTDKTYVATCLGRGDCWYGARRSAVASVSYRW
ncbi:TonB-dependent siderophore receptor [Aquincola sp. J276]|uniref:TonB-dependent siderophore receptor n=1 Tax=Aquincola sp. J276 TaxID=2898432 RepID=UPI002150FCE6|nr:TonB-dependent siderophore receptor [Aquincola sp. J276]MCR5866083.1 TonB-dependent siderophore receptor [Aquincola sp. J276]